MCAGRARGVGRACKCFDSAVPTNHPTPATPLSISPRRFGDTGWCQIFHRLLESNGKMPGLPGASSFVDVQDLAGVFVAAADAGRSDGGRYIIGGTNASNIEMQVGSLCT